MSSPRAKFRHVRRRWHGCARSLPVPAADTEGFRPLISFKSQIRPGGGGLPNLNLNFNFDSSSLCVCLLLEALFEPPLTKSPTT